MPLLYRNNGYSFYTRDIEVEVIDQTVQLAVEIAREGREGRKIGTLFTIGDEAAVLQRSTNLILDPLLYHPDELKYIGDPSMRETVKELAQLDGGFVVTARGVVCSACRYINASAEGLSLTLGLGSRHMAAASISRRTKALAVVVSESSVVRVFNDGAIVAEIIPELWLLNDSVLPTLTRDISSPTKTPHSSAR
jgi:diadenylate cyclase